MLTLGIEKGFHSSVYSPSDLAPCLKTFKDIINTQYPELLLGLAILLIFSLQQKYFWFKMWDMKHSRCCRLNEFQPAIPGIKILELNLDEYILKCRKVSYPRLKLDTEYFRTRRQNCKIITRTGNILIFFHYSVQYNNIQLSW